MALINQTTQRVEVPHEPGEWVDVRRLTGAEMDEASEARTDKVLARMGGMLSSLERLPSTNDQSRADSIEVRRATYDADILINYALQGWSYDAPLGSSPAALLDALTRDWLWEHTVEANTRPPALSPGGELSLSWGNSHDP